MVDNWQGQILFHSKFLFKDGDEGEKLIIVLNNPLSMNEPYLVCRTTSNKKNKPDKFGCHAGKALFLLPSGHDFFKKDTWLQLYEIFPFDYNSFLQDHFNGELIYMGRLSQNTVEQLTNCIRNIRDIVREHKNLILK